MVEFKKPITGKLIEARRDGHVARSTMTFEGTSPQAAQKLYVHDLPRSFFPSATFTTLSHTRDRRSGLENPMGKYMGGIPIMHTELRDMPDGSVRSKFSGPLQGGAKLSFEQRANGEVVQTEATTLRPNFRFGPMAIPFAVAESVPVFGRVARTMRETAEGWLGDRMLDLHVKMVADDASNIAKALEKAKGQGYDDGTRDPDSSWRPKRR